MYYKLTNYYQNHRRYVQSYDSNQFKGQVVSASTLSGGECDPLSERDNLPIYPCGLIANSVFNGEHIPVLRSYFWSQLLMPSTLSDRHFLRPNAHTSCRLYGGRFDRLQHDR